MNTRQSLYLVFAAAGLYAAWELIAHQYLMYLPMTTWHWLSAGVGTVLALAIAGVAMHGLLLQERKLREVSRLKDDLNRLVVQDLRSPLMAIMGALETLKAQGPRGLPAEAREMIDMALDGSRSLFYMTSDLADISRMQEGGPFLETRATTVPELLSDAVHLARPEADARKITLVENVEPDIPKLMLDGGKVRRVASHLLMNALRFTHFGGSVKLRAHWDRVEERLFISVSDTGQGIAPEHRDKIFDMFFRVNEHQADRVFSGGLGLAFSKMVAEAHGGSIRVESVVGEGSTFTLEIPAQPAPPVDKGVRVLEEHLVGMS